MAQPMRLKLIFRLLFLIAIVGTKCTVNESADCTTANNYPAIIASLSSSEMQTLQESFNSFNQSQLCSHEFDSYGVIEPASICGLAGIIPQGTEALMIARAKKVLVKFGEFTNVHDTSMLFVDYHGGIGINTERMLVKFENQIYQGLEVMDTDINVWVYANGARMMYGGWQKEIVIPDCETITEEDARDAAVGTEIIYWGLGGPDTVVVSEGILHDDAIKVIVPIIEDESKELRLAWRLGVGMGWYLYVDVFSGDVLRIDQLFVT